MVATAILGAGVVGAGASIWGANKAADAQTQAAQAAISNQQNMYQQNAGYLSPFIQAGQNQLTQQQALLNPNSGGALSQLLGLTGANGTQAQQTTLENTPGYQFTLDQGLRSVNNQLAARGLGGSGGAVAKGASQFTTGLANNTWQSVVQALTNTFNAQAGAGQNLINSGAGAAGALAGVGTNTANSISGSLTGAGNANAAAANATGSAVSGAASSLPSSLLLAQLLKGNSSGGQGGVYSSPAVSNYNSGNPIY